MKAELKGLSWGSSPCPLPLAPSPHLDDAVHVRDEAVDADLQQHDQRPAHVLADLAVLVPRQRKQTLPDRRRAARGINFLLSVCRAWSLLNSQTFNYDWHPQPLEVLCNLINSLKVQCVKFQMGSLKKMAQ